MMLPDVKSAGRSLVATARHVQLLVKRGVWSHEEQYRADIEAFWEQARNDNPALFNGRFYILDNWHFYNGMLTGRCRETSYAAYLHWRAGGFVSHGLNAFAMPVLCASDGGVLIGRMAPWTANAGTWYMPAGSIDAEDVMPGGLIDLVGNMRRELLEEIGIVINDDMIAEEWSIVFVRGRLAMFRRIHVNHKACDLLAEVGAHLGREKRPELDDLRIIRRRSDCAGLKLAPFLPAYLETLLPA